MRSFGKSRTSPFISESLNTRMTGGTLITLSDKAVAIASDIVFCVSGAALTDFNVRTIGVRWSEI